MTLTPCRHLNYEGPFDDCSLMTMPPPYEHVRFWVRGPRWTVGRREEPNANPARVQFCRLRGRINGVFDCYGEMGCHEPANGDDEKEGEASK